MQHNHIPCTFWYFNPRTHRGVRLFCLQIAQLPSQFQSTHPSWGATLYPSPTGTKSIYFNPRTHRGVRPWGNERRIVRAYFNPRTHRGVRQHSSRIYQPPERISIHAPIVGCDVWFSNSTEFHHISIHAPIVGCDLNNSITKLTTTIISIHAPIVGCDNVVSCHSYVVDYISIHAPIVGCDLLIVVAVLCHI